MSSLRMPARPWGAIEQEHGDFGPLTRAKPVGKAVERTRSGAAARDGYAAMANFSTAPARPQAG